MASSAQSVATQVVFDYLYKAGDATTTTPKALVNAEIRCTLTYDRATSTSPITSLAPVTLTTNTDSNGYWSFNLVPNTAISPANTTYTIQTPYSTYQITVGASGPYQSTAVGTLVTTPAPLAPATTNLTGPLTVAGAFTSQGALTAQSTADFQSTAQFDTNALFHGPDPWYDVKHPTFGAKGDGTTDDTTAIQSAENTATTNGGIVFFPPGTYIVSSITKQSNTLWVGCGVGTTVIKLKNSASTSTAMVVGANFATLTGGNTTGGITGWGFYNLTFDGNKANNASYAVPLLQWYGYGFLIDSVAIINAGQDALYSEWSSSGPVIGPNGLAAKMTRFSVQQAARHGIHWNGPHDSIIADGNIENSSGHGLWLDTKAAAIQLRNVHAWGGTQDWGFFVDGSAFMFHCQGEDGTAGGVWARSAGAVQIMGGAYFATPVGLRLGITAGTAATNCSVGGGALFYNCSTAAFDFQNDGGNNVIDFYSSGGNAAVSTGTQSANTVLVGRGTQVGGPGLFTVVSSGQTDTLAIKDTGGNGANLKLLGNGGTTPSKTLRAQGGHFQVINDAYNGLLFDVDDVGNLAPNANVIFSNANDTFAASYTPDANVTYHALTLTGNITVNAPNNSAKGKVLILVLVQDGTGGRTITYNAAFRNSTGPAIVTTLNTKTIDVYLCYDGANWILLSRQTGQT